MKYFFETTAGFTKCLKSLLLFLIFTTFIFSQNYKENDYPKELQKNISVNFIDTTLEDALKIISDKAEIKINFSTRTIPAKQKVNLQIKDKPVYLILDELTQITQTKLVITEDNEIIISRKSAKPAITGRVIDKNSLLPLYGVNVVLKDLPYGAATNSTGYFSIINLDPGDYTINCNYIGYKTNTVKSIELKNSETVFLEIEMEAEALKLGEIVITPGSFSIMKNKSYSLQTLSKEEIDNMSFGEDVYRAITRIPGISTGDFTSRFTVRGGENDETLVCLDGMTLSEPFHVKEIYGGALSIIDAAVIGNANVMTGGFSAEYGDKMSGVFNIKSISPNEGKNTISASISLMNARLMSQGNFANNRGSWILSARRGYLDFILDLVSDKQIRPTYYDVYGKAEYLLSKNHKAAFNVLYAGDSFSLSEKYSDSTKTRYDNLSTWLTINSFLGNDLFIESVVYFNYYKHSRYGLEYDEPPVLDFLIDDKRSYNMIGVKQNWQYNYSDNVVFKLGFDVNQTWAKYNYNSSFSTDNFSPEIGNYKSWYTRSFDKKPEGTKFGSYVSLRLKLLPKLITEIGLRYDQTSYTEDRLLSPRINLAYEITPNSNLRLGYGHFYQSQGIHQIRAQVGENGYYKAELAEHYVIGFEHSFSNNLSFRLEGYYKKYSDLKPAHRNLSRTIEMFPEVQWDKITLNISKAEVKGLEIFAKYDKGGLLSCWASYAYSVADDYVSVITDINNLEVNVNKKFPRLYDQRHALNFDINFRPGKNWHINLAWQYRSGWPITERKLGSTIDENGNKEYYVYVDEYHSDNFPPYHRLDIRVAKYFLTQYGKFHLFLDLLNVYARENIRSYEYDRDLSDPNNPIFEKETQSWFPLLPSIGIRWDLEY